MWEIAKKLKISYNAVYYSLYRTAQTGSNQNRKRSGRPRCTTEQEDKYIRMSSLRNRCLTSPQLAASLNSTRKTPVSTSTVKRRLRDAGLLDRVPLSSVLLPILTFYFYWPVWDGFFFATLPRRPASRSRLFTVNVETGVLRVLFNEAAKKEGRHWQGNILRHWHWLWWLTMLAKSLIDFYKAETRGKAPSTR